MKLVQNLLPPLLMLGATVTLLPAAPITWSAPVDNIPASGTLTEGALVLAENSGGPASVVVNTVPFTGNGSGPGGSNTGTGTFYTGGGGDSGDPDLNTMLNSHSYQSGGFSFEITGLTIGNIYKIQIWAVGDTRTCCNTRTQEFGDGEAVPSVSASMRRDSGAAVVGEFTADAATQTIVVTGSQDPGLSAYQVRQVGTGSDTDGDGIPDLWEQVIIDADGGDAVTSLADVSQATDFDGDGLTDGGEYTAGANPLVPDSDGDGLTDGDEVNTYGTSPVLADTDGDTLTDDAEVAGSTSPLLADTDSDGVNDNLDAEPNNPDNDDDGDGLANSAETNTGTFVSPTDTGTNPLLADTDGDTLNDGDEISVHLTDPTLADTDGDSFDDGTELAYGTDPTLANDKPFLTTTSIRGTGTGALLTGDLTDPENDGVDTEGTSGTNFNWVGISASSKAYFTDATPGGFNEGAFDIFDNKVGGGESKWCCDPGPQNVTVEFSGPTILTHFTVTSGGDADQRDPRIWAIQGSNDGTTFTDIYRRIDAPGTAIWTARNQVVRFDLPVPSLPYTFIRYQVDAMRNSTTQHQLNEIEYFGVTDPADTDMGGLPDVYELAVGLNPNDINDDTGDLDGDGLNNLDEAANGTNPLGSDTDNDGLSDGDEVNVHSSNPNVQDSDGDGLTDGDEVNTYGSSPILVDTDGDGFTDPVEVTEGSLPGDAGSLPNLTAITSLGTGAGSLLGGDITDPENDGVQGAGDGLNFDWATVSSSSESNFGGFGADGEGAFDIFDNEVGGGGSKWCCDPAPQWAGMSFRTPHVLTHFTVTSGNDSPDRDPGNWSIQGSNDGVTWTDIYPAPGTNDATYLGSPWTQRNETMRFDLPAPSLPYTWFRYNVIQVRGPNLALHQLNEVEFFGIPDTTDTDMDRIPDWYENQHAFLDPGDGTDASEDQDGDEANNFLEFAQGTDPETANPALVVTGEDLTVQGGVAVNVETIVNGVNLTARFQRIRDPQNYGITYAVEFSHNLTDWFPSSDPGTVIADGDGAEVVEVPYPFFLQNGRKARFVRVTATYGP